MGDDEFASITWRELAIAHPEFVQWAVQRNGGVPDGLIKWADLDRLQAAYRDEALEVRGG